MQLVVRNRVTGKEETIDTDEIPKIMHPTIWHSNPYWQHSKALLRSEVKEIFQPAAPDLSPSPVKKVCRYIVDYVKNVASAAWLLSDDKPGYLKYMTPYLKKLDQIMQRPANVQNIQDMITTCLNCAMDPF